MTTPDPTTPPEPTGEQKGADVGVRFVARLIDMVILGVVNLIIAIVIIGAFFDGLSASSTFGTSIGVGALVAQAISIVITIGYFAWLESSRGQTVGKMILRLRTVGPHGGNPTMEESIRRNAWYALAIVPIIGGLAELAAAIYIAVTISQSPVNRGWHDEFAGGTKVIAIG